MLLHFCGSISFRASLLSAGISLVSQLPIGREAFPHQMKGEVAEGKLCVSVLNLYSFPGKLLKKFCSSQCPGVAREAFPWLPGPAAFVLGCCNGACVTLESPA